MNACRFCKSADLVEFLKLGDQPVANNLLSREQLAEREPFYPIDVFFCRDCKAVQVLHDISPDEMFKNYFYVTSETETFRRHFEGYARGVTEIMGLGADDLVVDVGSNVGMLLKNFQKLGVRILGVDPAANIARLANENGVETFNDYFVEAAARRIAAEKGRATVVTANNTFSQVGHYDEFMRAVREVLTPDGALVIEVPYLMDLIAGMEFDTIYHEHHGYFTVTSFQNFLRLWGFELFDVQRQPVHGGTIRVFAKRSTSDRPVTSRVAAMMREEEAGGVGTPALYLEFASRIAAVKESLVGLLQGIKEKKGRIAGYGAPAKATVLMNYCGLDTGTIDYVIDKNPLKQNHYIPGVRVPIVAEEVLHRDPPDYLLILAWNFLDEILVKEKLLLERGVRFIVPVPVPKIL